MGQTDKAPKKRKARRVKPDNGKDKRRRSMSLEHREKISKAKRENAKKKEAELLEKARLDREFEKETGRKYAGDYLESVFKYTGVKALVDYLVDDCGCQDRKVALNNLHEDLSNRFNSKEGLKAIYDAYQGIFGEKIGPKVRMSQCAPCHKRKIKKMRNWFTRKKIELDFKNGEE